MCVRYSRGHAQWPHTIVKDIRCDRKIMETLTLLNACPHTLTLYSCQGGDKQPDQDGVPDMSSYIDNKGVKRAKPYVMFISGDIRSIEAVKTDMRGLGHLETLTRYDGSALEYTIRLDQPNRIHLFNRRLKKRLKAWGWSEISEP